MAWLDETAAQAGWLWEQRQGEKPQGRLSGRGGMR